MVLASRSLLAADTPFSSAPSSPQVSATQVSGSVSTRYVHREATRDNERFIDQDVFGDLRLDIMRPEDNRYELHFFGAGRSDLDKQRNANIFDPFEDRGDASNSRSTGDIYSAHIVLNDPIPILTRLRIGRQAGTRDEPVLFDGMGVDLGSDTINVSLYGGAAIHFQEIDSKWGKDTLGGAGIDFTPLPSMGMSLDYLAVKDRNEFISEGETLHDRMVALKAWQRFGPYVRASEKYRRINGQPRDVSIGFNATAPEASADLVVNYLRQLRTQNELTNEFSAFYTIIGQSSPYQSYDIKIRKYFFNRIALDLGYFRRELLDSEDSGPFNKEYTRSFADVEMSDLFIKGLSGMILVDQWKSRETGYRAIGCDLSYRLRRQAGKEAKFSIGSYSSLYKYDYYLDLGVRERVRTNYVTAKYPFTRAFSMNIGFDDEHGIEHYQTLRAGMRYDF